jgi:hypothetical protein
VFNCLCVVKIAQDYLKKDEKEKRTDGWIKFTADQDTCRKAVRKGYRIEKRDGPSKASKEASQPARPEIHLYGNEQGSVFSTWPAVFAVSTATFR